jgi:hypothetical protein
MFEHLPQQHEKHRQKKSPADAGLRASVLLEGYE